MTGDERRGNEQKKKLVRETGVREEMKRAEEGEKIKREREREERMCCAAAAANKLHCSQLACS